MAHPDDEAHRRWLEGRAELLEATLLRYRALHGLMGGLGWRGKLLRNSDLLRETANVQREVEEALAFTQRRSAEEQWPAQSAVVQTVRALLALLPKLRARVEHRLGEASGSLGEQLLALEKAVAEAPRVILPGQQWDVARALLPLRLPEVQGAAAFAAVLAPVFSRPAEPGARLPYSDAELTGVEAAWAEGEANLQRCWARLKAIDVTGVLLRDLRRRATRMPRERLISGAEHFVAAVFWRDEALARMREVVGTRVDPVVPADEELLPALRWLTRREADDDARLPALPGVFTDGRAGLFELAYELYGLGALREGAAVLWERLRERAVRAELDPVSPDSERVRNNLLVFLRVVGTLPKLPGQRGPPIVHLSLSEQSLVSLVSALERRMGR